MKKLFRCLKNYCHLPSVEPHSLTSLKIGQSVVAAGIFASLNLFIVLVSIPSNAAPAKRPYQERLITIHGAVTETVFALGKGSHVVGVDTTSAFPSEVQKLPQVGFYRSLSAEGIAALNPTTVLSWDDAGPPIVVPQLESLGIRVLRVPSNEDQAGTVQRIQFLAKALDREQAGQALISKINADFQQVQTLLSQSKTQQQIPQRVLFIYAKGAGNLLGAGKQTGAHEMIQMAGGINALEDINKYKPITPEGLIRAKPDVILLTQRGEQTIGGMMSLFATPGLSMTPAGQTKSVIVLEDTLLLNFGPRLGEGVLALAKALQQAHDKEYTNSNKDTP
ncbi:MAG: ABC transporter substrate-binding protein [Myxococcales bacterium]|nr:ABC transporter substrate-binding protein [Myxococcales bacterium]